MTVARIQACARPNRVIHVLCRDRGGDDNIGEVLARMALSIPPFPRSRSPRPLAWSCQNRVQEALCGLPTIFQVPALEG